MGATKWWEWNQNNSGGSFDIDDARGIGPRVWIEATNIYQANHRAKQLGIYYDGVSAGMDCGCCGDRWYEPWDDGEEKPDLNPDYDWAWHDTVYLHHMDGAIERVPAPEGAKNWGRRR